MSTSASRSYNFVNDKNAAVPITASRVDGELDNIITKLNQKVIIASSAPSSPIAGMLWYDSTNKLLKQYRNSEWVVLAVHIGTSAPSTPQLGDLWFDTTTSGTAPFGLLKAYNGNSAWQTHLSHPANSAGYMFAIGTTVNQFTTIPPGTSGYPLASNGVGSAPTYQQLALAALSQKIVVFGSYTGNGSTQTVAHGLGTAPRFIMILENTLQQQTVFWTEGLGTRGKGTAESSLQVFGTVPDGTNMYFNSDNVNSSGNAYYFLAMRSM